MFGRDELGFRILGVGVVSDLDCDTLAVAKRRFELCLLSWRARAFRVAEQTTPLKLPMSPNIEEEAMISLKLCCVPQNPILVGNFPVKTLNRHRLLHQAAFYFDYFRVALPGP